MVKFNERLGCFHIDLYKRDEEQPWLILAIDHRTGAIIASGHGKHKNRDAWPPVANALGMKP
jgi:hypothetical protein